MIYYISIYLMDILKINLLIFLLFEYLIRKRCKWIVISNIVGLTVITLMLIIINDEDIFIYLTPIILLCVTVFTIKNIKLSFIVIPVYLGLCLIDVMIGGLVALLFRYNTGLIMSNKRISFTINLISLLFYLILVICYSKKRKVILNYIKGKYMILITTIIIVIVIFYIPLQIMGINSEDNKIRLYIITIVTISIVAFIIIAIIIIYSNYKKMYYKEQTKINEKLLLQQKVYYQRLIGDNVEIMDFKHDIRHIMLRLDRYIYDKKLEEAKEFLDKMNLKVKRHNVDIVTGNDTINIIVNDIIGSYGENRVPIIWSDFFPQNVIISDIDICILFSNLLKNAVESEINVHELNIKKEENYSAIKVNVKYFENTIYFTMVNRVEGKVNIHGNVLLTSKQNKEKHGFGSANVYKIVTKYNGNIKYTQINNEFIVEIIFNNIIKQ